MNWVAAKEDSLTAQASRRRKSRQKSYRPFYVILGLYIAISLGFYIGGVIAATQQWFHPSRYARAPLDINEQTGLIDSVQKEASQAGIKAGDRLQALNGVPFTGDYQLWMDLRRSRPGEALTVTVRQTHGEMKTVQIYLALRDVMVRNAGDIGLFAVLIFLPLVSLGVGYWVVAARPGDLNAWLVLLVLSNTEAFFGNLDWRWWPNPWFAIFGAWWVAMATLGDPALVLLGVYFPERWRMDVRWPWAKWLILVPLLAGFPSALLYVYVNSFMASWGPAITPAAFYFNHVVHVLSAIVNIVFWIAIFDKMRSATTADARRRLRVLAIGSAISLGPVELIFVVFPLFGLDPHHNSLYELIVLFYIIFILTLAYVLGVQRAMEIRILVRIGTKYLLARTTLTVVRIAGIAALTWFIAIPLIQHPSFSHRHVFWTAVLLAFAVLFFKKKSPTDLVGQWIDRKFFREAYDTELVLTELSQDARRFTEKEPLIETITRRISDVLHIPQIAVWLRGSDTFYLQQALGIPLLEPVLFSDGSATVQTVARADRPVTLYREDPDEWFVEAPEEERVILNRMNTEVLLGLPGRDRLMGVIVLGPKQSEEPYTASDLRLLNSVATQTGLALEVSNLAQSLAREAAERERIHREIEIAREVQERLFPQRIPAVAGVDLAGHCRPAQSVGGDYYDFMELEGGCLGLAVGDVSGKGISAALLMASLRASLRGMTLYGLNDLAGLMQKVNGLVYEASASNRYATFFFAVYDPASRELRYVNAGHNPPVLLRGDEVLGLETGGPVVGLLPSAPYVQGSLTLAPGDTLLAYTDGVSEAMTATDEEWGEERMIEAFRAVHLKGAEEIVNEMLRAADAFTCEAPQHDDMTVLVMKISAKRS